MGEHIITQNLRQKEMNYTELDLENIEMQQVQHAAEQKVFKIR